MVFTIWAKFAQHQQQENPDDDDNRAQSGKSQALGWTIRAWQVYRGVEQGFRRAVALLVCGHNRFGVQHQALGVGSEETYDERRRR
jgi:hypothetical protein